MKNLELIDRYFQNDLSPSELADFNEALKNDVDFNKEFQELKEIRLATKASAQNDLSNFLNALERDIQKEEESTLTKHTMKKYVSIAACVVLIAAVSFFTITQNSKPTGSEIFSEYYTSYDNLAGQVRGAATIETLSAKAYGAYDAGNYILAAENFESLVAEDKSATNYFYMGLSNIENGDFESAVTNLNVVVNNFSDLSAQAKWYMSLALIANGAEEEAFGNLAGLTLENSAYKEKAKAILKSLGAFANDLDGGVIVAVEQRPKEEEAAPSGASLDFEGRRQYQFGTVVSETTGIKYRFFTDDPIDELEEGAEVEMIVLRQNKNRGFAYILGKR
ncbi:hypothetical protein [Roseivirga pacifica]|uniref:hypothetical protein n=1 Tax=Roseivirga pacifica TaxID=1267423 RepID=UPI003BB17E88